MSTDNTRQLTTPLLTGNPSQPEDAKSQDDSKQEDKVAIAIIPPVDESNYFFITRRGVTLRIPLNQVQQSIDDLTIILSKLTSWSELNKTNFLAPVFAFFIICVYRALPRPNMPAVLEDLADTVGAIFDNDIAFVAILVLAALNGVRQSVRSVSLAEEVLRENDAAILRRYIEPLSVKARTLKNALPDLLLDLEERAALLSAERFLARSIQNPPSPINSQSVQALTEGGGSNPSLFSSSSLPTPPTPVQPASMEPTAPQTERKEEQKASSTSTPG